MPFTQKFDDKIEAGLTELASALVPGSKATLTDEKKGFFTIEAPGADAKALRSIEAVVLKLCHSGANPHNDGWIGNVYSSDKDPFIKVGFVFSGTDPYTSNPEQAILFTETILPAAIQAAKSAALQKQESPADCTRAAIVRTTLTTREAIKRDALARETLRKSRDLQRQATKSDITR